MLNEGLQVSVELLEQRLQRCQSHAEVPLGKEQNQMLEMSVSLLSVPG